VSEALAFQSSGRGNTCELIRCSTAGFASWAGGLRRLWAPPWGSQQQIRSLHGGMGGVQQLNEQPIGDQPHGLALHQGQPSGCGCWRRELQASGQLALELDRGRFQPGEHRFSDGLWKVSRQLGLHRSNRSWSLGDQLV
jgi:hypothetical protein